MTEIDIENYITGDGYESENGAQFYVPFPRCNHTKGISQYNIGYAQGYLNDGTPFDAEVFTNDDNEVWLSVVLPYPNVDEAEFTVLNDGKDFADSCDWDKSVLTLGLQEVQCLTDEQNTDYAELLLENEIFYITEDAGGRLATGNNEYYLDDEGNLLIKILVALKCDDIDMGYTDLNLRDFSAHANFKE